ncbi:MAG: hypothetical protein AAB759_02670 [Patescibacteria group bacterium]
MQTETKGMMYPAPEEPKEEVKSTEVEEETTEALGRKSPEINSSERASSKWSAIEFFGASKIVAQLDAVKYLELTEGEREKIGHSYVAIARRELARFKEPETQTLLRGAIARFELESRTH